MLTDYYTKFKRFTKTQQIIFVIVLCVVFISTVYIITILSSFLDAILSIVLFYTMFVFIPYDNRTYLNQDVFYLTTDDCNMLIGI